MRRRTFTLGCCILLLLFSSAYAKDLPIVKDRVLPGELRASSQGDRIYLEGGKSLFWPPQGPLILRGSDGKTLDQVDLSGSAKRQSGAEALGLQVEEVDLGGSMSGKKKYLSGKKAPTGRKLDAGALSTGPNSAEAGQIQKVTVGGIPMSTTSYPNGSSLWHIEWPSYSEDIYFDKKKTLVSDLQSHQQGTTKVSLQQYADGSYLRNYQKAGGTFRVTYDANDQSYRLSFANAQGDLLRELRCETTCSED